MRRSTPSSRSIAKAAKSKVERAPLTLRRLGRTRHSFFLWAKVELARPVCFGSAVGDLQCELIGIKLLI